MLNIIDRVSSKWISLVIVLSKRSKSHNICINFCKLKSNTIGKTYPFLQMGECIDAREEATVMFTLNGFWKYWNMSIAEEHKDRE